MNGIRDYFEGSVLVKFGRTTASKLAPTMSRLGRMMWRASGLSSLGSSLRQAPLRTCGMVLAIATLTHLALLWALGRTLPIGGWLFRFGLLAVGVLGCFSRASWAEVREGSVLFRLFLRRDG